MISFEQARDILDAAMDALPEAIFDRLNGGVLLSPEAPRHPESVDGRLYVLGRYICQPTGLGRFIEIYYGSFVRLYGGEDSQSWTRRLTEVLHHELTHHLESLAGDRSLEIEDGRRIARYNRLPKET